MDARTRQAIYAMEDTVACVIKCKSLMCSSFVEDSQHSAIAKNIKADIFAARTRESNRTTSPSTGRRGSAQMSNVQLSVAETSATLPPSARRPTAAAPLSQSRAAVTTCAAAASCPSLVGGAIEDRGTSTQSWRRLAGEGVKELVLLGQNV